MIPKEILPTLECLAKLKTLLKLKQTMKTNHINFLEYLVRNVTQSVCDISIFLCKIKWFLGNNSCIIHQTLYKKCIYYVWIKTVCKQDLVVVFFYKCVGLLSFSVTAYYISSLHKEKKECGKTLRWLANWSFNTPAHSCVHALKDVNMKSLKVISLELNC